MLSNSFSALQLRPWGKRPFSRSGNLVAQPTFPLCHGCLDRRHNRPRMENHLPARPPTNLPYYVVGHWLFRIGSIQLLYPPSNIHSPLIGWIAVILSCKPINGNCVFGCSHDFIFQQIWCLRLRAGQKIPPGFRCSVHPHLIPTPCQ